jgi:hypothetical protein
VYLLGTVLLVAQLCVCMCLLAQVLVGRWRTGVPPSYSRPSSSVAPPVAPLLHLCCTSGGVLVYLLATLVLLHLCWRTGVPPSYSRPSSSVAPPVAPLLHVWWRTGGPPSYSRPVAPLLHLCCSFGIPTSYSRPSSSALAGR